MKLSLSDELKPYWLSVRYSLHSRQFGACFADWLIALRNDLSEWITGWVKTTNEGTNYQFGTEHHMYSPSSQNVFQHVFVNQLFYETMKQQQKKTTHRLLFNHREMICFLSHTAPKMFSLKTYKSKQMSVLNSAQQTTSENVKLCCDHWMSRLQISYRNYFVPLPVRVKGFQTLSELMTSYQAKVL